MAKKAAAKTVTSVDTPCSAYNTMSERWELIDDLLGGTLAMQAAGEKWLPREDGEKKEAWLVRLSRSVLFGALADAIEELVSKPFSKPVTVTEGLEERLEELVANADGHGTDLTQFARSLFEDALAKGLTHVLVDFPPTASEDEEAKPMTHGEEKRAGVRPFWVHIKAADLIGWKIFENEAGHQELEEIRIVEDRYENPDDDPYGEVFVRYIRVITREGWELFRKLPDAKAFTSYDSGSHSFGRVPLLTFYTKPTGFMTATPPLEDLAWMNLAHWQSDSDQRNILRYARTGLLFLRGITAEEKETPVQLGPNRIYRTESAEADMKFVEHHGHAIKAGAEDIRAIEEKMEQLGLKPLLRRNGNLTATEKAIDNSSHESDAQAWIRGLEELLVSGFEFAGEWISVEVPEDFAADIYNDFTVTMSGKTDIQHLGEARKRHDLSLPTYLSEIRRRGMVHESMDVDDEVALIKKEKEEALTNPPVEDDPLDDDEGGEE